MQNYWQALGLPLPNADAASLIIPWKEQATDSLLAVSSGKEQPGCFPQPIHPPRSIPTCPPEDRLPILPPCSRHPDSIQFPCPASHHKSHPRSPAWQTDNLFLGASQHWNFLAFLSYPSRGARVPNGEGDPPPRHPSARAALKALTNTQTTSSDPIPMREGSMQPSIYSHRHSPMACPLSLNCGLGSTRCLGGAITNLHAKVRPGVSSWMLSECVRAQSSRVFWEHAGPVPL